MVSASLLAPMVLGKPLAAVLPSFKSPVLEVRPTAVTSVPKVTQPPAITRVPFKDACRDSWTWSYHDKSHEVRLIGLRHETAHFHPNWSNGTAAVRGTTPLNGGRHYWEIEISQRIFGTSMMFGVCTGQQRLHADAFLNLIGENSHGWGLSHKGLAWHDGAWRHFTTAFRENEATTIGMLFDGSAGTLTYYKDGECLGTAFTDLEKVTEDIYPVICSTAAKTEMAVGLRMRGYQDLQDRCRAAIVASMHHPSLIEYLPLPSRIVEYVREGVVAQ